MFQYLGGFFAVPVRFVQGMVIHLFVMMFGIVKHRILGRRRNHRGHGSHRRHGMHGRLNAFQQNPLLWIKDARCYPMIVYPYLNRFIRPIFPWFQPEKFISTSLANMPSFDGRSASGHNQIPPVPQSARKGSTRWPGRQLQGCQENRLLLPY